MEVDQFSCPVCGALIGPHPRGITFHARTHGINAELIWQLIHDLDGPPRCSCSPDCTCVTNWRGWHQGYATYVMGHYDKRIRSENTKIALKRNHWARGKTKENDERLRVAGTRVSKALKEGFASGRVKHWSKGLTKETHPLLAAHSLRMRGLKRHFYEAQHVADLVNGCLGNRFVLLSTVDDIAKRASNRTMCLSVMCTRCNKIDDVLIYNVIRKKSHRCEKCDPIKQWTSIGENELAQELEHMFGMVSRYVRINGWSIDMHVPSIDTYVQYDGIYWHGLDRPVSENTNAKIVKKYYRDIEQVEWFASHGMKLVRIIETEWNDAVDKHTLLAKKLHLSFNFAQKGNI